MDAPHHPTDRRELKFESQFIKTGSGIRFCNSSMLGGVWDGKGGNL